MKSKKVHVWLKQKIASSLPSNCSWCDTDDSEKWVPLLLCDSSSIHNNTHYILKLKLKVAVAVVIVLPHDVLRLLVRVRGRGRGRGRGWG